MSQNRKEFQPGAILNEVLIGCFRSAGGSLHQWCAENGIKTGTASNAIYGRSGGKQGQKLLNKIIDAADRDIVTAAYTKRMIMEAERLGRNAA